MVRAIDGLGDVLLDEASIEREVARLGAQISGDYADKPLHLVGVLKGSALFVADLVRELTIPATLDFISTVPYAEASASGVVRIRKDLDDPIEGKDVLVVEGICASGLTLSYLLRNLESREPASLEICALLTKPDRREIEVPVRYVGFEIPNRFAIGYGLDHSERFRNLPYVAALLDP